MNISKYQMNITIFLELEYLYNIQMMMMIVIIIFKKNDDHLNLHS